MASSPKSRKAATAGTAHSHSHRHGAEAVPVTLDVNAVLRKAGLRRTPVRVGVVKVLRASGRPLSVPAMLGLLRGEGEGDEGGVDSVTVYRTLNTFIAKGLVHRVKSDDRSWLYALGPAQKAHEHKHPHFVCQACGKVECLEGSVIPDDFVRSLGVREDYAVTYPEVVLHGTCAACG